MLRSDFPSLELSTIRYYEDQELIKPSRTKKGYRLFSESDVETLRFVLQLRDQNVPIPEIRARMIDRGMLDHRHVTKRIQRAARPVATASVTRRVETTPVPAPTAPIAPVALHVVPEVSAPRPSRYSGEEFLSATGLNPNHINNLQSQGFLAPVVADGATYFTSADFEIAVRAKTLIDQGLDVRHLLPLRRIATMVSDYVETISRPLDSLAPAERAAERERVADEIRLLLDALISSQLS
jgi:DNA-binding transcriptional MerR regulator